MKAVKVVVKNYGVRKMIQTFLIYVQVIAFYAKGKYKGLRDYNRKLIYRATGINVGLDEILELLFNF